MTEDDWLGCIDPSPMLRYLIEQGTPDRKCRLLACASCRQVWGLLFDPRSRTAVEVAERYADGQASRVELARARADALAAAGGAERQAGWAAYWAVNTHASGPLWNTFAAAAGAAARQKMEAASYDLAATWDRHQVAGQRQQVALVHEVIGNPFRTPQLEAHWSTWGNGIIPALALGIYEDEAWDRLPILGDALEEAGCVDEAMLGHCREPGQHVRGCWVVDLLLSL